MAARRARAGEAERREVADRLHSAAIHLLRAARRTDESAGLTPSRLSALSVVVFRGPLTLGELAAAEQVRPPTVTRLVAALEERGLVAREPDVVDARISRVRATAAGRALLARARARRVRFLLRRLEKFPPDAIVILSRAAALLEELVRDDHGAPAAEPR